MIEIYMNKGFSRGDAETILNVMFNYRDFFIDHMMVEVGLMLVRLLILCHGLDLISHFQNH